MGETRMWILLHRMDYHVRSQYVVMWLKRSAFGTFCPVEINFHFALYIEFRKTFFLLDWCRFQIGPCSGFTNAERNSTLKVGCSPLSETSRKSSAIILPAFFLCQKQDLCFAPKSLHRQRFCLWDQTDLQLSKSSFCRVRIFPFHLSPKTWNGYLFCYGLLVMSLSKGRAENCVRSEPLSHNLVRPSKSSKFFCVLMGPNTNEACLWNWSSRWSVIKNLKSLFSESYCCYRELGSWTPAPLRLSLPSTKSFEVRRKRNSSATFPFFLWTGWSLITVQVVHWKGTKFSCQLLERNPY